MLGGDYLGVNYPGVFILGGNVLGAGNCLATIADKIYETVSRNQSRNQAKVVGRENFEICFCVTFVH